MKQVIMWFVENEIAQGLLKDGFKEGDVIVVDTDGTKQLTFRNWRGLVIQLLLGILMQLLIQSNDQWNPCSYPKRSEVP